MIRLEPLTGRHARDEFDCGAEPLNRWLAQTALQHQVKGISRTIVAISCDESVEDASVNVATPRVLGFYALAAGFVLTDELPPAASKRYPRQVPITRLGRLAIQKDLQGQGLGKLLLTDAIVRARGAAQAVGSAGIFVDAKDANAARFYGAYGFQACLDDPLKLYLAMW